jgi:hypothetical protein
MLTSSTKPVDERVQCEEIVPRTVFRLPETVVSEGDIRGATVTVA